MNDRSGMRLVDLTHEELIVVIDWHLEQKKKCAQNEDFVTAEKHRLRALALSTP